MPFKSEAQRRYLWANEPEIARDWTDTYGSRIQKNGGGIMHNFANYAHDDGSNVSVPRSFQARPHSDQVNLAYITPQEQGILQSLKPGTPHRGPMEIPNYDSFDLQGGYATSGQLDAPTRGDIQAGVGSGGAGAGGASTHIGPLSSGAQQDWTNTQAERNKYKQQEALNLMNAQGVWEMPGYQKTTQMYNPRSKWGIGNLFRGAMGMFGGWPGRIGSMLSHIDPRQLRGINSLGGYNTQRQYEEARNLRRDEKRMAYLSDRRARGLDFGDQAYADLLAGQGYSGQGIPDLFQNAIDKHSIDFDPDARIQDTSFSPVNVPASEYEGMWNAPASEYEGMWDDRPGITKLAPEYDVEYDIDDRSYPPGIDEDNIIDTDTLIEKGEGPRITQIGGNGLQISQEMLEVPIKTLERTIANLEAGIEAGIELSEFDKNQYERMKKVIEIKKKKGETAEGTAT